MAKLVSKTHGDALFELAVEENCVDSISEEVIAVEEALKTNPDLFKLLNHPKIDKVEKIKLVKEIFDKKVSDNLVGFLTIMIDKERQNNIIETFEYFTARVKEYKNIGVVTVATPMELSETQKEELVKKLLATTKYVKLEVDYKIDESLIGGMVIRIGDRVVDSSIKTKLSELTKDLTKIQLA